MRWKACGLAILIAFAFASAGPAAAHSLRRGVHHSHVRVLRHHVVRRVWHRHGRVRYTRRRWHRVHRHGFVRLVGDPRSGLGFYPLPYHQRVRAWRYRMRRRNLPPWIENGVLFAIMADSARYNYAFATPIDSYKYGVFDPYAGLGTPYFAGYYGPASGDENDSAFPFGRPYDNR